MDDLQYFKDIIEASEKKIRVLNLVINGWPSIPKNDILNGKLTGVKF